MPQVVRFGKVTYYNDGEGWGFVSLETNASERPQSVFFHIRHLGAPYRNQYGEVRLAVNRLHRSPIKVGDQLAFLLLSGPRGARAEPWTFADVWREAVAYAAYIPRYVITKRCAVLHEGTITWQLPERIFAGTLDELEAAFPRHQSGDKLDSCESTNLEVRYQFCVIKRNGRSKDCSDPRQLIRQPTRA